MKGVLRMAGHIACMGRRETHVGLWWGHLKKVLERHENKILEWVVENTMGGR
jgi:hypothetical protein